MFSNVAMKENRIKIFLLTEMISWWGIWILVLHAIFHVQVCKCQNDQDVKIRKPDDFWNSFNCKKITLKIALTIFSSLALAMTQHLFSISLSLWILVACILNESVINLLCKFSTNLDTSQFLSFF